MRFSKFTRRGWLFATAGPLVPVVRAAAADWSPLFDGKTLAGWEKTGNAAWSIEDGAIVGRQGPGGAAGDLFTEKHWKDFDLEAEWKMRWPGNSDIWFRYSGPKTGYQADFIDQPSHPGVLSGSLYCVGKAFIAENRDASSVNKDDWNSLRIRASGNRFEIRQNGKKVIEATDDAFPAAGSIGIQVHPGDDFTGMEVRVRNLRIRSL